MFFRKIAVFSGLLYILTLVINNNNPWQYETIPEAAVPEVRRCFRQPAQRPLAFAEMRARLEWFADRWSRWSPVWQVFSSNPR